MYVCSYLFLKIGNWFQLYFNLGSSFIGSAQNVIRCYKYMISCTWFNISMYLNYSRWFQCCWFTSIRVYHVVCYFWWPDLRTNSFSSGQQMIFLIWGRTQSPKSEMPSKIQIKTIKTHTTLVTIYYQAIVMNI
jgi:hypothetical protein